MENATKTIHVPSIVRLWLAGAYDLHGRGPVVDAVDAALNQAAEVVESGDTAEIDAWVVAHADEVAGALLEDVEMRGALMSDLPTDELVGEATRLLDG